MSRWRVIEAGVVTPKGNASTLEAPAVLRQHFAPVDENATSVAVPFDRSLPMEKAAYRSCELIHEAVEGALGAGQRPLLLGGECSLIAGSLSAAFERIPKLSLAFFDAHGDFNTPQTSPSQYLGGMCFAHVCGLSSGGLPWRAASAFPGDRALLIGGRDLDPGEHLLLRQAGVRRVDPSAKDAVEQLSEAIGRAPLWIHVDLDVVDPGENFAVSHPAPGGISFGRLGSLLQGLARNGDIRGIEICGYQPAIDPNRALPARIAATFAPVLGDGRWPG